MTKKKIFLAGLVGLILISMVQQYIRSHELKLTGTLEMTEHSLGARSPGRLVRLSVEEGQTTRQGELLGVLDRYEQAKKDFDRLQALHAAGGASDQSLEQAKLILEDQEIVSPVNGVVLQKIREVGEVVGAGSVVVIVGDTAKYWVKIYVPEGMVNRVLVGQKATLHFDGLKKPLSGHVSFVAPRAEFTPRNVQTQEERVTQTFAVKVVLDEMIPNLRPGVAADVTLIWGQNT